MVRILVTIFPKANVLFFFKASVISFPKMNIIHYHEDGNICKNVCVIKLLSEVEHCLRPYNDFFNLHTFDPNPCSTLAGGSIYISSSKSPFKKALLMSNCCRGQSKVVASDKTILTVFSFATGAKVSK